MRLDAFNAIVAALSLSILPTANPAPCYNGTLAMDVASAADLELMSDTINCTGGGTFEVAWIGTVQLAKSIEVSDNQQLTITGSSPLPESVIDGGNTTNIVSVYSGSTLNLIGLVLKGGNSNEGGAVSASDFSFVNVVDCSFTNNNASFGGAIFAHLSEVNIDGETTFSQNTAQHGGVIYANESEVHIDGDTWFEHNSAQVDGGAIYARLAGIDISGNSSFANNSAKNYAGAIYFHRSDAHVDGTTSFEHNTADEDAEVVIAVEAHARLDHRDVTLSAVRSQIVFTKQSASGAVYAFTSDIHIDGEAYFGHNFANDSGGVFFFDNCSAYFNGIFDFRHNSALVDGGAILAEEESSVHFEGNASFVNNFAYDSGGVVGMEESELHFGGRMSFTDNGCVRSGGVVYADSSGISISGEANFSYNSADVDGGVIHLHKEGDMNITGTTSFENNSAANSGGVLYVTVGSTFYLGGDTYFSRNTAGADGGVICTYSEASFFIDSTTTFFNNEAKWRGGALYSSRSEVRISGKKWFFDNVGYDGGALVAHDSSVHIDGSTTFEGNSADHDGGAVNLLGSNATIMGVVEFSSNAALNGGGIFFASCPEVDVRGTISFTDNTAVLDGGAISLTDPIEFYITDSSFSSNQAGSGGAVSLSATEPTIGGFERCVFDRNLASNGGALYLITGDTGDTAAPKFVLGSVFRNNIADESGGAIFNVGSLAVYSTRFAENSATEGGLAILNGDAAITLWNVTFDNNVLVCLPDEYSDFDYDDSGNGRFQLACQQCLDGNGEVDPSAATITLDTVPVCKALPIGVAKSSATTLATFDLLEGYYRTSVNSREVLECYRGKSCNGGTNAADYCATGYTGPYCAVCSAGYVAGLLGHCRECSTENKRLAIALAATAFTLFVVLAVWFVTRPPARAETEARARIRQAVALRYKLIVSALPLSAFKIVVVVLQIITQFTEIAGAVYPAEYESFLSNISTININLGFIMSTFCIVTTDFYDRLLIATLAPLVLLAAMFGLSRIMEKITTRDIREPTRRHKHLSTGLFILFFVYSSVSFTIFQTFVCDNLDDGSAYLRADYGVSCNTPTHDAYRTYAGIMMFIYPIGIPALFAWWLSSNRKQLLKPGRDSVAHLHQFRGLWAAYKPSCYYYEVVECCRRIVLTGAAVFVFPNSADQIAVVLLLAIMFMFVSESLSPFESKSDMWLYRWGNGIILASMYVALLMKFEITGTESGSSLGMTVLLIAANVFMIVTVIVQAALLVKKVYLSRRLDYVNSAPCTFDGVS